MVQYIIAKIQSSLREWVSTGSCTHGYIVTDGGSNMLAVVQAVSLKGIVCLVHTYD